MSTPICPECSGIAEYNAYYSRYTCTSCTWEGEKASKSIENEEPSADKVFRIKQSDLALRILFPDLSCFHASKSSKESPSVLCYPVERPEMFRTEQEARNAMFIIIQDILLELRTKKGYGGVFEEEASENGAAIGLRLDGRIVCLARWTIAQSNPNS